MSHTLPVRSSAKRARTRIPIAQLGEGLSKVVWDGRVRGKRLAPPGRYRARVTAKSAFGKSEIFADVVVRRRPETTARATPPE